MSPFWQGFFSIFGRKMDSDIYTKHIPKPFEWYHKGEWWEHPIYKTPNKKKKGQV
jgi:hypothetical protein